MPPNANPPVPPIEQWSDHELFSRLVEAGNLRHMMQPHQLADYDQFHHWNDSRHTRTERRRVKEIGALYDNLYLTEWARRVGKTVFWLILAVEHCIRYPKSRGMIFTPFRLHIGSIIVPICEDELIWGNVPDHYRPIYRGSHGADEVGGLWIDATNSFIKLVGVDANPSSTRGNFLDFAIGTEAAFCRGLRRLVEGVIMPQFQGRPHAWLALESSTAEAIDHDFNDPFRVDAQLRSAYTCRTLDYNSSLTEEQKEFEIRRCGGQDSPTAKRELYCKLERDPDLMVIPEFSEAIHVKNPEAHTRPRCALAYVGCDPGTTDPCGLVWLYCDFTRQQIVVEAAWAASNRATSEHAQVIRQHERQLWASDHLDPSGIQGGPILDLADALKTGDDRIWDPPEGSLTYWDRGARTLRPNPITRVSDTAAQQILDLRHDHNLVFETAEKSPGSADADLQHLRGLFKARKIVIVRNGMTEKLIAQLRSGQWSVDQFGKRTDWKRTPTLGHLDCLDALKYAVRAVNFQRDPFPPNVIDVHRPDMHYPAEMLKQQRDEHGRYHRPNAANKFLRSGDIKWR